MLDSLEQEEFQKSVFVFNPESVIFPDQYAPSLKTFSGRSHLATHEGYFEKLSDSEARLVTSIAFNSTPFARYVLECESSKFVR